jgi:hypothetical protein
MSAQAHPATHQDPAARRSSGALLVFGGILILVGIVAMTLRALDVDLDALIGEQTWPLLVIVPGIALLGLALTRTPPEGLGFAIGGSIVTAVGAILLVQANTETWESWAYVWALIPGAAGLGIASYGVLTRSSELIAKGARMMLISGVLFVVGWWYFEAVFATGRPPISIDTWWPLAVIGAGAIIATRAWFRMRGGAADSPDAAGAGGPTP